jgi:uncharacterized cupredoxin-like copper-binding protein
MAITAALMLVLVACGASTSEGETPTTAGGSGTSAPGGGGTSTTIKVTEKEFSITPNSVTAQPGKITFEIKNTGAVAHDITITVNGTEQASPLVQPGSSETWVATVTAPGTYDMFCSVPGHKEAGMNGTLKVGGS